MNRAKCLHQAKISLRQAPPAWPDKPACAFWKKWTSAIAPDLPATWPLIRARRVGYTVSRMAVFRAYIKAINDLKREKMQWYWRIITRHRNFPLHCRCCRRQPATRARSRSRGGRYHRAMRCPLHGRNIETFEPRQDRAHSGYGRRVFAGGVNNGADVRALREAYPGVPIVTYVNTSAAVKAESDVCCTSSNAKKVVEAMGTDRVCAFRMNFLHKILLRKRMSRLLHGKVAAKFTSSSQRRITPIPRR